jgi:hypothetical protein
MVVSKFFKASADILLEYIYDDGNNISDSYELLINLKNNNYSYIAATGSSTNNTLSNQLFPIDTVTNNYGLVDTINYSFIQLSDYPSGIPVRHDTIKIHLPVNYTFGQYIGCYVRVYAFDINNKKTYDLSNFYFDQTNISQSYLLNYSSPPILFQEKLWGKEINFSFPSAFAVSNQLKDNTPTPYSINYNLTSGVGLSLTSPIFIDFSFITKKKTVNKVTTYYLTSRTPMSVPQSPSFESLGVKIQHSINGDFFEIFGTYNGDIGDFNNFINNSVQLGNRYYVTYTITLYEQNIRGKSFTVTATDNFDQPIEYRPIIKYTTTTAIIDVEMNVIDAVDNSSIYRRASYGMLQDEVSKYSLSLMKINLNNAHKPKIYNIKSPQGAGIFGNNPINSLVNAPNNIVLEPVKVNYTVLTDKYNVVAKSDNSILGNTTFYGIGNLKIMLHSVTDNVLTLIIAQDVNEDQAAVDDGNGVNFLYSNTPVYMDMSNMGDINFVIQNDTLSVKIPLFWTSNVIDLTHGVISFKIPQTRMNDVGKIYDGGNNAFYITSTLDTVSTVVYSGLFTIYDRSLNDLNNHFINNRNLLQIVPKVNTSQATAIVTISGSTDSTIGTNGLNISNLKNLTQVSGKLSQSLTAAGLSNNTPPTTSTPKQIDVVDDQSGNNVRAIINADSSIKMGQIDTGGNWIIDDYSYKYYTFTTIFIKNVYSLNTIPTNLTFVSNPASQPFQGAPSHSLPGSTAVPLATNSTTSYNLYVDGVLLDDVDLAYNTLRAAYVQSYGSNGDQSGGKK